MSVASNESSHTSDSKQSAGGGDEFFDATGAGARGNDDSPARDVIDDKTVEEIQAAKNALEQKLRERQHLIMRNEDAKWIGEKEEEIGFFKDALQRLLRGVTGGNAASSPEVASSPKDADGGATRTNTGAVLVARAEDTNAGAIVSFSPEGSRTAKRAAKRGSEDMLPADTDEEETGIAASSALANPVGLLVDVFGGMEDDNDDDMISQVTGGPPITKKSKSNTEEGKPAVLIPTIVPI